MLMFKDKYIAQAPQLASELHAMRNMFQEQLKIWYDTNKNKYSGSDLQKQLTRIETELDLFGTDDWVLDDLKNRIIWLEANYHGH